MMKAGKKHGVRLAVAKPADELRRAMPLWHHAGEGSGRSVADTGASRCLRERHGVSTVGDCRAVAERLWRNGGGHRTNPACGCFDCVTDRTRWACDNPPRCATAARKAIQKLVPMWRPGTVVDNDRLSLTSRRKELNREALARRGRIVFDPTMTDRLPMANAFRAFTTETVAEDADTTVTGRPRAAQPAPELEVFIVLNYGL
ncbi:hypothetical protein C8Q76DRAFT_607975 [Earliella scabrosa]|nr:hypothetical protein C8Q76DRAFT_607975 [Earliella scabrosa]